MLTQHKICRKGELVNTHGVCGKHIEQWAQVFFWDHVTAIFVIALVIIAVCAFVANSPRQSRPVVARRSDPNLDYQLQQINNGLRELRERS